MSSLSVPRMAGLLYLVIILCGMSAELLLRGPLIHPADAAATLAAVLAAPGALRGAILLDAVMVAADVAVAVLLFRLLRAVNETTALMAMAFRLLQAATIAAGLLALVAVDIVALRQGTATPEQVQSLMLLHGIGYDVGLIFFAVNTGLVTWLFARSGLLPRGLLWLLGIAAAVYLAGSVTRIAAPELNAAIQAAYTLPLVAETWLALTLIFGRRMRAAAG